MESVLQLIVEFRTQCPKSYINPTLEADAMTTSLSKRNFSGLVAIYIVSEVSFFSGLFLPPANIVLQIVTDST